MEKLVLIVTGAKKIPQIIWEISDIMLKWIKARPESDAFYHMKKKAASTFMLVKYVAVFEGERWKSGNAIFG